MSTGPRRLADLAHGRSGDKGNHANVAVLAYTPEGYAWLRERLTAEAVGRYFAGLGPARVVRGGLEVELLERRVEVDLAVGQRVEGAAAGHASGALDAGTASASARRPRRPG